MKFTYGATLLFYLKNESRLCEIGCIKVGAIQVPKIVDKIMRKIVKLDI